MLRDLQTSVLNSNKIFTIIEQIMDKDPTQGLTIGNILIKKLEECDPIEWVGSSYYVIDQIKRYCPEKLPDIAEIILLKYPTVSKQPEVRKNPWSGVLMAVGYIINADSRRRFDAVKMLVNLLPVTFYFGTTAMTHQPGKVLEYIKSLSPLDQRKIIMSQGIEDFLKWIPQCSDTDSHYLLVLTSFLTNTRRQLKLSEEQAVATEILSNNRGGKVRK